MSRPSSLSSRACLLLAGILAMGACGEGSVEPPAATGKCAEGERRCNEAGEIEVCVEGSFFVLSACPTAMVCVAGECVDEGCVPSCDGRECGDDGCGGSCGGCSGGESCTEQGLCVDEGCVPSCDGRECGDDGCGGSCGSCPGDDDCVAGVCQNGEHPWVSAYLASWNHYVPPGGSWGHLRSSDIDWDAMTHLIYFHAMAGADGSVGPIGEWENLNPDRLSEIVPAAHANQTPILLSIGGWGNTEFQDAIGPGVRQTFVSNLVSAMTAWGFDGLDIDMEPLRDADRANYAAFIEALSAALGTVDMVADYPGEKPIVEMPLLTAALEGPFPEMFASLEAHFDQLNIMTYDMAGPWPGWVTWHNAPLYDGGHTFPTTGAPLPSTHAVVQSFLAAGVPPEKLGIGADFYGYVWAGGRLRRSDGSADPTAGVSAPRQIWHDSHPPTWTAAAYHEILDVFGLGLDPVAHPAYRWDAEARVPYLTIGTGTAEQDRFVSFDDARACREKVAYVRRMGLGGLIIWELGGGLVEGAPDGLRDPLLQAIRSEVESPTLP